MQSEESHLSHQELLLAVDGELTPREAERVESHLAACWACRVRKQEIETAIGEFVRFQRQNFDLRIPPSEGRRALLKAQLAETQRTSTQPTFWSPWFRAAAAAFGLLAIAYIIFQAWPTRPAGGMISLTVPNPNLTPGATVLVSRGEVCRGANTKNKAVPVALRRRVFDEYGIPAAEPSAYEVDYLITPALGGADDIHNLWPQSYKATVWNAQVKDALEDHLRDLVCDGQLDLTTAQHEIATNWIEAYKKYFHTDRPLSRFRQ
jgi:hypothetical protein